MADLQRARLLTFTVLLACCGARSSVSAVERARERGIVDASGGPRASPDATLRPDGPGVAVERLDGPVVPDRECPPAPAERGACAVALDRRCFYDDAGPTACRCEGGRWACEAVRCDGWGPECLGYIFSGFCSAGAYCGACCETSRGRRITGCRCVAGQLPLCIEEELCRGF